MEILIRNSNGSRLAEQFGLERPILACPISEPGLFPTVGIEIEVPWHVELPKPSDSLMRGNFYPWWTSVNDKQQLDAEFDILDAYRKPDFQKSLEAGYPYRSDAFWEFALDPILHYSVLQDEVSALYQCGLLKPELTPGDVYPLHITVSHLHNDWREVGVLAFVLELMGATTADRIVLPTIGTMKSWACKGSEKTGGTKLRTPPSMLYTPVGTEFRTLGFDKESTALESIRTAQILGRLMVLHRKADKYRNEYAKILATCSEIAEPNGVKFMDKWQEPKKAPEQWRDYGKMISNIQGTSELAKFRSNILDICDGTENHVTPNKYLLLR